MKEKQKIQFDGNKLKTKAGITLIALVVTIVVLLILAGVSISMLTGDSGIIKQAQDAKNNTIIEDEKEGISLAYMACKQRNMFSKNVTNEELQTQMNSEGRNVTVTTSGEDLVVVYNKTNNKYKISQTGEIEKQKNLTEEEAKKIVDIVSFLDGNIYVLTAGDEVKLANQTSGNIFTKLESDTTETITTNGVRCKGENFFVDNKGKVYTWGYNSRGQLGNGTTENSNVPICISDIEGNALKGKNIVSMLDCDGNMVAIDKNGKVYTWGKNDYGLLGNGTTENSTVPICISDIEGNAVNGKNITNVYDGIKYGYSDYMIIAKDIEGKIYTWGKNNSGQLGNGTTEDSNVPMCISDIEGNALKGKRIVDIYADGHTTIAKDANGKIYTWGGNYYGQLGNGSTEDSNVPMCISDIEGNELNGKEIIDINMVESTIIAKDIDGKIYTWGYNLYGQLGDGTLDTSRAYPICISDIDGNALNGKNITNIYMDYQNGWSRCTIIARDIEGKIYTWGYGEFGQLGNGTTQYKCSEPQCISDIEEYALNGKKIVDVTANNYTILARDEQGKVYAWGLNDGGQLGNGSTESSSNPICISDIENSELKDKVIRKIYAGYTDEYYICYVTEEEVFIYRWMPTPS